MNCVSGAMMDLRIDHVLLSPRGLLHALQVQQHRLVERARGTAIAIHAPVSSDLAPLGLPRIARGPHTSPRSASSPSSWILRVSVLRPMPSRCAASMRRPPVCASASRDQRLLELARQLVA